MGRFPLAHMKDYSYEFPSDRKQLENHTKYRELLSDTHRTTGGVWEKGNEWQGHTCLAYCQEVVSRQKQESSGLTQVERKQSSESLGQKWQVRILRGSCSEHTRSCNLQKGLQSVWLSTNLHIWRVWNSSWPKNNKPNNSWNLQRNGDSSCSQEPDHNT